MSRIVKAGIIQMANKAPTSASCVVVRPAMVVGAPPPPPPPLGGLDGGLHVFDGVAVDAGQSCATGELLCRGIASGCQDCADSKSGSGYCFILDYRKWPYPWDALGFWVSVCCDRDGTVPA